MLTLPNELWQKCMEMMPTDGLLHFGATCRRARANMQVVLGTKERVSLICRENQQWLVPILPVICDPAREKKRPDLLVHAFHETSRCKDAIAVLAANRYGFNALVSRSSDPIDTLFQLKNRSSVETMLREVKFSQDQLTSILQKAKEKKRQDIYDIFRRALIDAGCSLSEFAWTG
ncbi:MAG: hypothetical protein A3F09_03535 [Chlamydiae bacterium RIFCSPHIGHO2_12_FULL_49_11]|nr:MAG: hypothetical protein A3F09_03535 [Chlamydiae bacterium RIFCSPHIGHO2_12_FULL_49_11]